VLEGYLDTNWVTSVSDNKSTSGWIFTLSGGAIYGHLKSNHVSLIRLWNLSSLLWLRWVKKQNGLRNMFYDIELWP
jgi:hypothetical protein